MRGVFSAVVLNKPRIHVDLDLDLDSFINPRSWLRKSEIFDFQTARSQLSERVRSSPCSML